MPGRKERRPRDRRNSHEEETEDGEGRGDDSSQRGCRLILVSEKRFSIGWSLCYLSTEAPGPLTELASSSDAPVLICKRAAVSALGYKATKAWRCSAEAREPVAELAISGDAPALGLHRCSRLGSTWTVGF